MNQTNIYEGSTAVVEHKDKDQAAVLEIAGSVILCGHQAYKRNAYQEHSHSMFTMMTGSRLREDGLLTREAILS
jgi:hypothetical protein